jgi:hypothetical protein
MYKICFKTLEEKLHKQGAMDTLIGDCVTADMSSCVRGIHCTLMVESLKLYHLSRDCARLESFRETWYSEKKKEKMLNQEK